METSGTYHDDGQPTIRFARTFPHPPVAVWEAISRPARLQTWFPTTVEFGELRAGEPIDFHFTQIDIEPMRGEFREVDAPHRLSFTWGADLLTFELTPTPAGDATRLEFTVALDAAGKAARDGAGWEQCLDVLGDALDGAAARPSRQPGGWQGYYDEYRRRGFPATAEIPEVARNS